MKRILIVALACIVPFFFGPLACGQHPVTPPTYTCPPAGSYADLNGATGSTSTTYTASNVTGQTCFEAQGYLTGQYGNPSNIVGPTLGGATNKVTLSVSCTAAAGQTCNGNLGLPERAGGGCHGSGCRHCGTAYDFRSGQACAAGFKGHTSSDAGNC